MSRPTLAALAALACLASTLAAGPALTIYNSDLAVIRESRPATLKAGRQTLSITGLPARLDPTSVHLEGEGLRLFQQDFDYDLVSPDRVLEKYVDQPLKAVGKGGQAYEGKLLSYQDGQLLLKLAAGRVQMLNRSELASLDFPELPQGLLTQPTLVWDIQAEKAGEQDLGLTYMSGGLSWHAEYVAVLDKDEKSLDLNGWVSVDNQSGATFKDAQLKLMAGDIHRASPNRAMMMAAAAPAGDMMPPPTPAFAERSFADYHLYTLGYPVTLRQAQQKQVELMSAEGVPVTKVYTYDGEQNEKAVQVTVEIKNEKAAGLGLPLPAGKWRVFKADGQSRELVGEDESGHNAKGETVKLTLGNAFDVVGERTVLSEDPDTRGRAASRQVKVELRNRRDDAVTVKLREHAWAKWDLSDSDQAWKRVDANTFTAEISLKAGEVKSWTYTLKMKY
jgi:hypothetical protein